MLFQIISLAGAILVLAAFAAQQLRKLSADRPLYQALNFAGGVCLCIAAVASRQYGFILLEGTWAVASAYGWWRVTR